MNTLTKISVVVLVLLIVVCSVVIIQVATVGPVWRTQCEEERDKNKALAQDSAVRDLAFQKVQSERDREKERADRAVGALPLATGKLQSDLDAEKGRYATLNGNYTQMSTALQELRNDAAAKETRNVDLVKQLNDARTDKNVLADEKRKSDDEARRLTLVSDRQEKQIESLQQQIGDKDELIKDLQTRLAAGGGRGPAAGTASGATESPDRAIIGTITTLNNGVAGIDVGSAKDVRKGMVAMIYRGAVYVGDLEIENVDVNESAGIVVKKKLDPAIGDKIEIAGKR